MKTSDLLIMGGLAVAAWFLLKPAQGSQDSGGGGGTAGSAGSGVFYQPPTSGAGSSGSSQGLYVGGSTLFYGGQGYSTAYPQAMVNQLQASSGSSRSAGSSSSPFVASVGSSAIAAGFKPSAVTPQPSSQGMSVGSSSPFIPSVTQKPMGFK